MVTRLLFFNTQVSFFISNADAALGSLIVTWTWLVSVLQIYGRKTVLNVLVIDCVIWDYLRGGAYLRDWNATRNNNHDDLSGVYERFNLILNFVYSVITVITLCLCCFYFEEHCFWRKKKNEKGASMLSISYKLLSWKLLGCQRTIQFKNKTLCASWFLFFFSLEFVKENRKITSWYTYLYPFISWKLLRNDVKHSTMK